MESVKLERSYLSCVLFGRITASKPDIDAVDLRIEIDNILTESKFTTIGTEPNDIQLLDELIGELQMSLMGRGYNRKDRRIRK